MIKPASPPAVSLLQADDRAWRQVRDHVYECTVLAAGVYSTCICPFFL